MPIEKLKTLDMEVALMGYLGVRASLIVPNISWGCDLHECDLLLITKAGFAWEIEIKTSKADLIKDKEKRHRHFSHKIKYLYFALPQHLIDDINHVPERAGIIIVSKRKPYPGEKPPFDPCLYLSCKKIREPQKSTFNYRFSDQEKYEVARLGAMRILGLKQKIQKLQNGNNKQVGEYVHDGKLKEEKEGL